VVGTAVAVVVTVGATKQRALTVPAT